MENLTKRLVSLQKLENEYIEKLNEIRQERESIIKELQSITTETEKSPEIVFDTNSEHQTLIYKGIEYKINGKKPFDFIKALAEAPKHKMKLLDLVTKVWGDPLASTASIKMLTSRLRKFFAENKYPLKLKKFRRKNIDKNLKLQDITGYKLSPTRKKQTTKKIKKLITTTPH